MTAAVDRIWCFKLKDYRRFDAVFDAINPAQCNGQMRCPF
jgi:hypothetical protein